MPGIPSPTYQALVAPEYRDSAFAILSGVIDVMGDAVVAVDERHTIIVFNHGAERLFGYRAAEAFGQSLSILLPAESRQRHPALVSRFGRERVPTRRMGERQTIEGVRKDGTRFVAGATIASLELEFGQVFVAIVRDISQHIETRTRLQASLELERARARTDPLTGLVNIREFHAALSNAIDDLRQNGDAFTVIYIDLDHFKKANDTYGHVFGDELLLAVSTKLREVFRDIDVVGRIGGDEFAVVFRAADSKVVRDRVAYMHSALQEAMEGQGSSVTFSIGALTCRVPPDSVEACMRRADQLMYRVKHSSRNGVAYGSYR